MVTPRTIENLELLGGDLALDFANTLEATGDGDPIKEHLRTPGDLEIFARRTGALPDGATAGDVDAACALRAAIHAVFAAVATGSPPPPGPLDTLLAAHASAIAAGRLTRGGPYAWEWERPDLRWPVAVAAVDLLRSPDGSRASSAARSAAGCSSTARATARGAGA